MRDLSRRHCGQLCTGGTSQLRRTHTPSSSRLLPHGDQLTILASHDATGLTVRCPRTSAVHGSRENTGGLNVLPGAEREDCAQTVEDLALGGAQPSGQEAASVNRCWDVLLSRHPLADAGLPVSSHLRLLSSPGPRSSWPCHAFAGACYKLLDTIVVYCPFLALPKGHPASAKF